MPGTAPPELVKGLSPATPHPRGLTDEERTAYQQLARFYATHLA
jgi:hypothetical protein